MYRYARYLAWMHMDEHRQDLAYQPFQSVMSFGSGGASGVGLGHGLQTLYLPEAHNDFVAAIVGEELGFVGVLFLCGAFLLLVLRGVRAALRAPDDYGAYLAFGIATMFGVQALLNLAVALYSSPTHEGPHAARSSASAGRRCSVNAAAAASILLSVSRQGGEPVRDDTPEAPIVAEDPAPEVEGSAAGGTSRGQMVPE